VAIISGIAAISIETLGYWLSLVFVPILVLSLALLTGYLGGMKIVKDDKNQSVSNGVVSRLIFTLTYKRRLFELILDVVMIGIAYYLAYLIRFGLILEVETFTQYAKSLPVVVIVTILSFIVIGVYRGVWKYVGINDLMRYFGSVLMSFVSLPWRLEVRGHK